MATPVELDTRGYGGTYKLVGGSPALDLANLVSYRGSERHHDWLEPPTNAERWRRAAGLSAAAAGEAPRLRELRELFARVFLALADGTAPPPDDVEAIGRLAAAGWSRRVLRVPEGSRVAEWTTPAPSAVDELAGDAARLLTSPEAVARISACGECRWVFLDTTRNRSRRWCDPADCGNRARQRRHYERTRRLASDPT